jgi:hypothetical protein
MLEPLTEAQQDRVVLMNAGLTFGMLLLIVFVPFARSRNVQPISVK